MKILATETELKKPDANSEKLSPTHAILKPVRPGLIEEVNELYKKGLLQVKLIFPSFFYPSCITVRLFSAK